MPNGQDAFGAIDMLLATVRGRVVIPRKALRGRQWAVMLKLMVNVREHVEVARDQGVEMEPRKRGVVTRDRRVDCFHQEYGGCQMRICAIDTPIAK